MTKEERLAAKWIHGGGGGVSQRVGVLAVESGRWVAKYNRDEWLWLRYTVKKGSPFSRPQPGCH